MDQYNALPKFRDVPKMPVFRADKTNAGDWKPEPEEALGKLEDVHVDYTGGNMAIVTCKVEPTHWEEPEETVMMFMKKHKTPAIVREARIKTLTEARESNIK